MNINLFCIRELLLINPKPISFGRIKRKMTKGKIVSIIILVIVVLAVLGVLMFKGDNTPAINSSESVATVNGVAIPKATYDTQLASALSSLKSQGVDVENAEKLAEIKTQVLDDLIANELIDQGISAAGIKADSAAVDTQIKTIIEQAGGEAKYKEELKKANLTEAQLKENITKQLAIQAYLSANIDEEGITVSDTEISQFYKEYSDAQKTASSTIKVPALKELSDQIKQQITMNKQQVLIIEFVDSLKAKAEIVKSI